MATPSTLNEQASTRRILVEDLPAHLATLEDELSDGCAIELVRGDIVVAELRGREAQTPMRGPRERPIPDFMGRMKEIFGEKPLDVDTTAWIREDRDNRD